jgi:hypothetical protein
MGAGSNSYLCSYKAYLCIAYEVCSHSCNFYRFTQRQVLIRRGGLSGGVGIYGALSLATSVHSLGWCQPNYEQVVSVTGEGAFDPPEAADIVSRDFDEATPMSDALIQVEV